MSQRGLGVCANTSIPREKIRLSFTHSLLLSTYFHAVIHMLDLRDHNLFLPYLVSYLVVSFIACVVCLVSRLVNWALLVLHRLRLFYFVLEIWKRPNSPPLLVHRSLHRCLLARGEEEDRANMPIPPALWCFYLKIPHPLALLLPFIIFTKKTPTI